MPDGIYPPDNYEPPAVLLKRPEGAKIPSLRRRREEERSNAWWLYNKAYQKCLRLEREEREAAGICSSDEEETESEPRVNRSQQIKQLLSRLRASLVIPEQYNRRRTTAAVLADVCRLLQEDAVDFKRVTRLLM